MQDTTSFVQKSDSLPEIVGFCSTHSLLEDLKSNYLAPPLLSTLPTGLISDDNFSHQPLSYSPIRNNSKLIPNTEVSAAMGEHNTSDAASALLRLKHGSLNILVNNPDQRSNLAILSPSPLAQIIPSILPTIPSLLPGSPNHISSAFSLGTNVPSLSGTPPALKKRKIMDSDSLLSDDSQPPKRCHKADRVDNCQQLISSINLLGRRSPRSHQAHHEVAALELSGP